MAEVLLAYPEPVRSGGAAYLAKACGRQAGHTWEGWIEFTPVEQGTVVRSGRETTQPNRADLQYWATGVTPVFLEGALRRALKPMVRPPAVPLEPPVYDAPAPPFVTNENGKVSESVLNPLSVIRNGEPLLRRQLAALSDWHLVNIVLDYQLSSLSREDLNGFRAAELVELIVNATRLRMESAASR